MGFAGYDGTAIISTHTPHARRDRDFNIINSESVEFQLTRLMRGVTSGMLCIWCTDQISTHTPHARRDSCVF